jgi:hypothetical protein
MANIIQIIVEVDTIEDLGHHHRVFFGFEPGPDNVHPQGREFRCRRKGGDANPFRTGTNQVTFGLAGNVANPTDNDPANPQLETGKVGRAYLRIDPNTSEPWKINDAKVDVQHTGPPGVQTLNLVLHPITLDEDAGEIMYFEPLLVL